MYPPYKFGSDPRHFCSCPATLYILFGLFKECVLKEDNSGIKFAALVVPKLGEAVIWRILLTKIVGGRLTKSDLNNYGEVIAR